MAKKKAKKQSASIAQLRSVQQPKLVQQPVSVEQSDDLFDLTDPDTFRRAFIASEILNRKY